MAPLHRSSDAAPVLPWHRQEAHATALASLSSELESLKTSAATESEAREPSLERRDPRLDLT
jgi:hypothetical protein